MNEIKLSIELKNISKKFYAIQALSDVSISVAEGEVRALVGENGAGKSTLIKIIAGAYKQDDGEIFINGNKVNYANTRAAIDCGISVIYQELDLIPSLNGTRNIFLGNEIKTKFKNLDDKKMDSIANKFLQMMQAEIDLKKPINSLTIAEQQIIAICKALASNAKIILMDEPSATLASKDLENLFKLIRNLKKQKITIIYISHRLEEIFEIADSITVLRDGKHISTNSISDLTKEMIIENMVGRKIEEEKMNKNTGNEKRDLVFEVNNLSYGNKLDDISFKVGRGEIFGILGLVGSGREELAKILFGIIQPSKGVIEVSHKNIIIKTPATAIQNSISYVPPDRRIEGLFLNLNNLLNLGIMTLPKLTNKFGIYNKKRLFDIFNNYKTKFNIKLSSHRQIVKNLSGGNQQKILLSRCLARGTEILILNEPTRGIDVGAKFEIYQILLDLSKSGKTIIVFSTEIPEVINICDRILILKKGKVFDCFNSIDVDQQKILASLLT